MEMQGFIEKLVGNADLVDRMSQQTTLEDAYAIAVEAGIDITFDEFKTEVKAFRKLSPEAAALNPSKDGLTLYVRVRREAS